MIDSVIGVGFQGTGQMEVRNGGTVLIEDGINGAMGVAHSQGSVGTLTIDGAGSVVDAGGYIGIAAGRDRVYVDGTALVTVSTVVN